MNTFGKLVRLAAVGMGFVVMTSSILTACAGSSATPAYNMDATSPGESGLELPSSFYFVGAGQIWRMERDGKTQQQITHEAVPVESFDVSPVDGALVFVSSNKLVMVDAAGGNRRVLYTGVELTDSASGLEALNDRERILGRIATPVWSPDGKQIAFILNGLNALVLDSGEMQNLHPNDAIPSEGQVYERMVIDSVISWSPDGKHVLLRVYYYPLQSVYSQKAALKTLSGSLTYLQECYACSFAWSDDSTAYYVGNPLFGGNESFSRCTIEDMRCTSIGQYVPARTTYFYAHPFVADPDKLYVFMATRPDSGQDSGQTPLEFMQYQMNTQGEEIEVLRNEQYSLSEALWAKDGQGVLIVTAQAVDDTPAGALLWLDINGSTAVSLPVSGARSLRWAGE